MTTATLLSLVLLTPQPAATAVPLVAVTTSALPLVAVTTSALPPDDARLETAADRQPARLPAQGGQAQQPAGQNGPRLQLDSLEALAKLARDTVNVTLGPEMLQFALPFMNGNDSDPAVKEMMSKLQGIYVRSFEFDADVQFGPQLDAVRRQLTAPWTRLIQVDSRDDGEMVEIYSWREGNGSGGLAIIAAEGRELTVVNIVGPIDLARLGALQRLGVPAVPFGTPNPR